MNRRSNPLYLLICLWLLTACSATKFVPEGSYLLDEVKIKTDDRAVNESGLHSYLRQKPNTKWFSLLKTQLYIYNLSGRDSTKWSNRFLRRLGDAPVIYNEAEALRSKEELKKAVVNLGYMQAEVTHEVKTKKKKAKVYYTISPGPSYIIRSLNHDIYGAEMDSIVRSHAPKSLLRVGMPLDVNQLDAERQRIATELLKAGYYKFNKEYIGYTADTVSGTHRVDLTMHLRGYRQTLADSLQTHRRYHIGNVRFVTHHDVLQPFTQVAADNDSLTYRNYTIYYKGKPYLRPNPLVQTLRFAPGDMYNDQAVQDSYSGFGRMTALKYTNIRFVETPSGNPGRGALDAYVLLMGNRPQSVSFEVEGTNSAGDLGAAAGVSYQHRNLFRGSELFTAKLRGAYEAITGLQGSYANNNYTEYAVETRLNFPSFLFPFLSSNFRRKVRASTEFGLQYNYQVRPEFTRTTASASWSYRWSSSPRLQHRFELLNVSFMYLPYISDRFREDYVNRGYDYIFRYNYQDRLIINSGYNLYYNSSGADRIHNAVRPNSYSVRFNVESAGNLAYALSKVAGIRKNEHGEHVILNIPYAQYLKAEVDWASNLRIDSRNAVAFHLGLGVAVPYGNAKVIPLEKQYFSGGANSVRGWSVRSLGPGSFAGNGNLLEQTGNIKFDTSVEYRSKLFWKLQGAAFVDAGNVWTIRDYENQPGGLFRFNSFYKQIAVAYGLGVRLDLDFFIVRFDGGMKAVNPAEGIDEERFPLLRPDFGRDFAFHFAVGFPF